MANHMDAERISALLDEPWVDLDGQAHLEACGECQSEFERLSRLRMALSALPDEKVPPGQWTAIEAALDAGRRPAGNHGIGRSLAGRFLAPGPLQAAAALVLFGGGVVAGLQFTGGRVGGTVDPAPDLPAVASTDDGRALVDGLNQMESLRSPLQQVGDGWVGRTAEDGSTAIDPMETAQALATLDGSIRALRDRLETNPDDPLASAYLLELVELRDQIADELSRANGTRTW